MRMRGKKKHDTDTDGYGDYITEQQVCVKMMQGGLLVLLATPLAQIRRGLVTVHTAFCSIPHELWGGLTRGLALLAATLRPQVTRPLHRPLCVRRGVARIAKGQGGASKDKFINFHHMHNLVPPLVSKTLELSQNIKSL